MPNQISYYNVKDYGAAGDGNSLDTRAIQQAIDACSALQGGTVYFPNGTYVTGTLHMRSNVTLYLEVSAVVLGSPNIEDYTTDTHKQRYEHESYMDRCLIYAEHAENIGFMGSGTIDGQGEVFPNPGNHQRPMLMRFLYCRNIRINSLRLRRPASWTSAFILCDSIFADSLDIHSWANSNGDGMDFDSCQNVFVSNSKFDTSDDSICLQNSEKNHSCKNVVINNCVMTSQWAAIRIGMMSSGDIEDVTISNCVFHDIRCSGFKIQSCEGGHIRNMLFENIRMRNVPRPIFLTLNNFRMGVDSPLFVPETGSISGLQFNNISVTNDPDQEIHLDSGIVIVGIPGHVIENISIHNFDYMLTGGGKRIEGTNPEVPEIIHCRPEASVFVEGLPAYALYARHAREIAIHHLRIRILEKDERPAMVFSDIVNLEVEGFKVAGDKKAENQILLENVRQE